MHDGLKLIVWIEPFGNRVIPLRERRLTLGRGNDQDICLPDRKISSSHALLEFVDGAFRVRDLGSTNGTYVNGHLVEGVVNLRPGDEVRFGNTQALFTDQDPGEISWPSAPPLEPHRAESDLGVDVGPDMAFNALDAGPNPGSDLGELASSGPHTVKFKLPDIERDLFASEEGDGAAEALQKKLQVLYRMTAATRGLHRAPAALLEEALNLLFEVVDADRGAFFLRRSVRSDLDGSADDGSLDGAPPLGADGLEEVTVLARRGQAQSRGISRGILAQVLREGEAILSRDAMQDQRFSANQSIYVNRIRSALAVPLRVQDEVLGVLHLDKREARRPFGAEDLQLAVIVAQQVAASIDSARLFQAISRTNRELERARDEILRWNQELELKVAERTQEVEQQKREIDALSRQKTELLGMVAHDLRTPLAGLLGFADLAIAGIDAGAPPAQALADLAEIKDTAQEMSELLKDLLDVSKMDSGKLHLEPRDMDLLQLIGDGRRRYEMWAGSKEIGFNLFLPAPGQRGLRVHADPRRLQQVLNNLISNAIKFSSAGAVVTLSVRVQGKNVLVSVTDTGQGIDPDDLPRIFGDYEQARTQATAGEAGSGLGLSIAKKLIELHGGEIGVESRKGVGSQFTFSLPLVRS